MYPSVFLSTFDFLNPLLCDCCHFYHFFYDYNFFFLTNDCVKFLTFKKSVFGKLHLNLIVFVCIYRVRQIPFMLENALKRKQLNILPNFFFYLKLQSFRLIMENNFIQMTASAGHTIGPIFKLHEYCPLERQLPLAYRRNTYL